MLAILKTVGGPGSLGFLVVSLAAGLVLMYAWPRARVIGRRWIVTVLGAYLVLSFPWVAGSLARQLPTVPDRSAEPPRLAVLIVLDGDNRAGRAHEAGRVYSKAPPETIWILGGHEIVDEIVASGVPRSHFKTDSRDPTTRAQLARVKILTRSEAGVIGVVASRVQMPRVAALAQASGMQLTLLPSSLDRELPSAGVWRWVPSLAALTLSRDALYEHAALAYYRWHRWI